MPLPIYQGDKEYVRPLNKDIEEVFDPQKNKFFKRGECTRWLLKDDNGQYIGRIAAFVNRTYKQEQPTGGIGFFECINSQEAANMLFNRCKEWLAERGMQAMDGPINFGERNKWWGLVIKGFYSPLYGMNYNPPYYRELFENYGFCIYYNQLCFAMSVKDQLDKKFYDRHAQLSQDAAYSVRHIEIKNIEQYAHDFCTIYNKAFATHGEGKSLEEKTVQKMFQTMKPVIDEHLSWFAYHNNEPIAMWVNLPDLNQYFKHLNGKFGIIEKLRFLFMKFNGKCNRFVGLVFGVIPEYRSKGVDAYLIIEGAKVIQTRKKYEEYEMEWIGDFNPKMVNIAQNLGTKNSRTLATYRYLFDRQKEFKRKPLLER